jgi:hypothetical protein
VTSRSNSCGDNVGTYLIELTHPISSPKLDILKSKSKNQMDLLCDFRADLVAWWQMTWYVSRRLDFENGAVPGEEHKVGDFCQDQSDKASLSMLTDFRTALSQMQSYIYPATTDIVQDNIEPGASVSGATNHYTDTHSVLETKEKDDTIPTEISISNSSNFGQNGTLLSQPDSSHW